ncbi:phosphodiester glycosidase family protein [Massilia sp. CCM 8692]|uniref:Phosphodiester glycosidase family protein n=2 Tax=Massilia rubra TaxID=2607910 RepID=A0ABX0M1Z3_9BURK|nr:phosphodiester glycosidase family protein [Massilia rubra]NHZ38296.1 phosphodiester glycosidase family protein [Massilia rubra]
MAILALLLLAVAAICWWIWERNGAYGFHVLARRGGTYWVNVNPDDARLSPGMRVALSVPVPTASAGPMTWQEREQGFEVAELPVMVDGRELDRILLARIDSARYRFVVRNAPAGDKGIDEWERAVPQARLIVNGSFFGLKGLPDTPFISEGTVMGPSKYNARAGAFVADQNGAGVRDLRDGNWRQALAGASNAMVSYPLLIGDDGQTHVKTDSGWLANRSFVAQDRQGRIIIGTTRDAFFSLARLAQFLKESPLDLKVALNLDGGPLACQSVRFPGYERKLYALWESQMVDNQVKLLRWPLSDATWAMAVVLTVEPKSD